MPVRSKVAVCFALLMPGAAVQAQSYTADEQELCSGDAFRLCSYAIPDVDRVTACMEQKQELLSPGCAQFFRKPAAQEAPAGTRRPASRTRRNN